MIAPKQALHFFIHNKLFILALGVLMISLGAIQTAQATDRHIITIHADGNKLVVPTKAETVADVLLENDIDLRENDLVEPIADTPLDGKAFTVNVYRARPITINDDGTLHNVVTPHRSPDLIAQAAGLELNSADLVELSRNDNFVSSLSFGVVLDIDRAHKISLQQYGSDSTVYTHANTVGEFLSEQRIQVDADDRLQPSRKTPLKEDSTVSGITVGKETVVETEVVKFPTRTINDADKEQGFREVQTAGVDGERVLTYEITLFDSQEVERELISNRITKQAKEEVVIIGVKQEQLQQEVLSATTSIGGTKEQWLAASGISSANWWAVDSIVSGESGWNPTAVNPSSGACGLGQQLPCGKWGGDWTDPVKSLQDIERYVFERYGGWSQAVAFRNCTGTCTNPHINWTGFKDHTWY